MSWLALIPLVWVLWLGLLAYGYSRMFNQRAVRAHNRKERHEWPPPSPPRR